MQGHKFFAFVQSIKPSRNTRSRQPLNKDTVAQSQKPVIQFQKPLFQTSFKKFFVQKLNRLCQALVSLAEISQEPEVTWRHDRQGYSYFEIYDPMTEQRHRFNCEEDARIWLDRSRYQSFDQNR